MSREEFREHLRIVHSYACLEDEANKQVKQKNDLMHRQATAMRNSTFMERKKEHIRSRHEHRINYHISNTRRRTKGVKKRKSKLYIFFILCRSIPSS